MEIKEQIRKRVARSGNSGAVWVPKDWLGEEIIVTRLETKKLSIEEEIMSLLMPYLRDISGVFLYGSYARNEEGKDSDIDVLVIAKNKFKIINKKFDIGIIEEAKVENAIKNDIFVYSTINEAKPIMNSVLLEELRDLKFDSIKFIKWFKESTEDSIKSAKELLELDKLEGDYVSSDSVIYSLILRLRGIFLINCVLKKKFFSNSSFKKWIIRYIPDYELKKMYDVYRSVRSNKNVDVKIEIIYAEKLLGLLQKEVKLL
ncbi:nucleotidyltransferase domain-containing protein [Candidatus Woesearchaeota archaeon]|nr:nucleotidyltransferase domain-containing protein [Candidatus Woesearchaeota archaeon]